MSVYIGDRRLPARSGDPQRAKKCNCRASSVSIICNIVLLLNLITMKLAFFFYMITLKYSCGIVVHVHIIWINAIEFDF